MKIFITFLFFTLFLFGIDYLDQDSFKKSTIRFSNCISKQYFLQDTCEGRYINERREGLWKCCYDGHCSEIVYHNGEVYGIIKKYNNKGVLTELESVVNGVSHGSTLIYSESGELLESRTYENGFLTLKVGYFENGALKEKGQYTLDTVIVDVIFFGTDAENDDISKDISIRVVKNGEWKYYNLEGFVERTEIYNEGELIDK